LLERNEFTLPFAYHGGIFGAEFSHDLEIFGLGFEFVAGLDEFIEWFDLLNGGLRLLLILPEVGRGGRGVQLIALSFFVGDVKESLVAGSTG